MVNENEYFEDIQQQGREDIPETPIEFMDKLIEPDVPEFKQIRRDIGLSKITLEEAELCEIYFEIARRFNHMAKIAIQSGAENIAISLLRGKHNYIEKVYETINLRRSVKGFQWEALNTQTRKIKKEEQKKKKNKFMNQDNESGDYDG